MGAVMPKGALEKMLENVTGVKNSLFHTNLAEWEQKQVV
jgi:hypothetical protein